jgi:hypothetical protein
MGLWSRRPHLVDQVSYLSESPSKGEAYIRSPEGRFRSRFFRGPADIRPHAEA